MRAKVSLKYSGKEKEKKKRKKGKKKEKENQRLLHYAMFVSGAC